MLQFIHHNHIDKTAWDKAIDNSAMPYFYAKSWYMDIVSPGWAAIINDSYSMIMPLPITKKWGINLITQPRLTQQMGVFAKEKVSKQDVSQFLRAIPMSFPLVRMSLNVTNAVPKWCRKEKRINIILSLNKPYRELYRNYSEDTKRNINKAIKKDVYIKPVVSLSEAIQFLLENSATYNDQTLIQLIRAIHQSGHCEIVAACVDGIIESIVFFVIDNNRFTTIASATSAKGRKASANYYIIDKWIEKHSDSDIILDFEGSSIPGIAKFYNGFGSETEYYYSIRYHIFHRLIGK